MMYVYAQSYDHAFKTIRAMEEQFKVFFGHWKYAYNLLQLRGHVGKQVLFIDHESYVHFNRRELMSFQGRHHLAFIDSRMVLTK